MDGKISEDLFASYLESHSIGFERDFRVCGLKNVYFKISAEAGTVLCDVKEVRDSRVVSVGKIDAYTHIRKDLKDLRNKFGRNRPNSPVVLVTMNFSNSFFTAHTVARAMYGDIGAEFSDNMRKEIHHLPRGNASMTVKTNTSISGVLIFDCACGNHAYFSNEFAGIKLPSSYFPGIAEYDLKRSSGENDLVQLFKLMFCEYDEDREP